MSHNPDFLDTIDEVAATEEFLDSVLEYMYAFSDFLMDVEKSVEKFPELQEYLTEDSHNAILEKHIDLTSAIINISQIEDELDESERAPVGENTIPFTNTISLTRFLKLCLWRIFWQTKMRYLIFCKEKSIFFSIQF